MLGCHTALAENVESDIAKNSETIRSNYKFLDQHVLQRD
jgi:hypothetical protein